MIRSRLSLAGKVPATGGDASLGAGELACANAALAAGRACR
jgi:hypothetical protein